MPTITQESPRLERYLQHLKRSVFLKKFFFVKLILKLFEVSGFGALSPINEITQPAHIMVFIKLKIKGKHSSVQSPVRFYVCLN